VPEGATLQPLGPRPDLASRSTATRAHRHVRQEEDMKCYYHPETDAVGTCRQCGKAACRTCIDDVGGALFCADCIRLAAAIPARRAKRTLFLSLVPTTRLNQPN
jgi:hypothetical protein